jgi:Lar family restriction alleviation protein
MDDAQTFDLKPCPFCGGNAIEKWATDGSAIVWAECITCGSKGGWARVGHGGSAADIWNRRVAP